MKARKLCLMYTPTKFLYRVYFDMDCCKWHRANLQQAPAFTAQDGQADAPSPSPPEAGRLQVVPLWFVSQAHSDQRQQLLHTDEDDPGTGDTVAAPAGGPAFPVWCWSERSAHWEVLQGKGRTRVSLTVHITSSAAGQEAAEQTQKTVFHYPI